MILHAQFFKRSKSIQIILAPRETSRTRVAKTWIEGTKEGGSNFVRKTRVLWAFSFKYYIPSKKKKKKKRKNLSIRSSPSQHARDLLEEQEWGWNNPPSRIPLPLVVNQRCIIHPVDRIYESRIASVVISKSV